MSELRFKPNFEVALRTIVGCNGVCTDCQFNRCSEKNTFHNNCDNCDKVKDCLENDNCILIYPIISTKKAMTVKLYIDICDNVKTPPVNEQETLRIGNGEIDIKINYFESPQKRVVTEQLQKILMNTGEK